MKMPKSPRFAQEDGGVTAEFVLIFPIIMLLVFLIAFISLLISAVSDVQQIAHELTRASFRYLAQSPRPADICSTVAADYLTALAAQSWFLDSRALEVIPCPAEPDANGTFTLSLRYTFANDYVQDLAKTFGLDLGSLVRSASTIYE